MPAKKCGQHHQKGSRKWSAGWATSSSRCWIAAQDLDPEFTVVLRERKGNSKTLHAARVLVPFVADLESGLQIQFDRAIDRQLTACGIANTRPLGLRIRPSKVVAASSSRRQREQRRDDASPLLPRHDDGSHRIFSPAGLAPPAVKCIPPRTNRLPRAQTGILLWLAAPKPSRSDLLTRWRTSRSPLGLSRHDCRSLSGGFPAPSALPSSSFRLPTSFCSSDCLCLQTPFPLPRPEPRYRSFTSVSSSYLSMCSSSKMGMRFALDLPCRASPDLKLQAQSRHHASQSTRLAAVSGKAP